MYKKQLVKRYLAVEAVPNGRGDDGATTEVAYNPEQLEKTTNQMDDAVEDSFKIISDTMKHNQKYKTDRREVVFKIRELPKDVANPLEFIRNSVEGIMKYIMENVAPEDKIGLEFRSDKFNNAAWLQFRWARDLMFEDVWNVLGSVFQSNSEGLNTDSFNLVMTQIKCPIGQGHPRTNAYNTFIEEWRARKGFVYVDNKDNLCLPRAIVIAKVYAENGTTKEKDVIRRNIGKYQDVKVRELLESSGVVMPTEGGGLATHVVLTNFLLIGPVAYLPKIIIQELRNEVTPVLRRFFVTLEDRLCISCAWDEGEELGDNGEAPLNIERMLNEMDDNHYFTAKFWYNRYMFPALPAVGCSSCSGPCYLEDDGSYYVMDEIVPGEVIADLYHEKMIQFHEEDFH